VSVIVADPAGLAALGAVVRSIAGGIDPSATEVRAAAAWLPGESGRALAGLAARLDQITSRVLALARVLVVVADDFARTEAGLAAMFALPASPPLPPAASPAAVVELLQGLGPAALEGLLVGSPSLARMVVDRPSALARGSVAAQLAAIQQPGKPETVVMRQSRALLLSLSDDERRDLALLQPALVTAVASAPVQDRVAACRVLLAAEIARLRGRLASGVRRRELVEKRLARYEELLNGRVVLARTDGSRLVRPHQLLAFDPQGDGRIAEVFGNLATATHLAVYVPGTGTSLDRYDGNAQRVKAFAAADASLAIVLWQNADFPDQPGDKPMPPIALGDDPIQVVHHQLRAHDLAAGYRDAADGAGVALAHDVEGLRLAAPGPASDLTVLGHSYGGSVVGSAEAHGLVVDRVVQIASAGAYVEHVSSYAAGECGTRRFSMTAPDDPIQLAQGAGFRSAHEIEQSLQSVAGTLPLLLKPFAPAITLGAAVVSWDPPQVGHGLDPDLIPGVTRLDTGVRPDGHSLVSGHGGMFEPGSTAWHNLLGVMRGGPVQVMEPGRWRSQLVPLSVHSLPHYEVTKSPYSSPGYRPPVASSTAPACPLPPGSTYRQNGWPAGSSRTRTDSWGW
jgi:Alpha/beta hydrolase